jgi:4-amino-4-deoxy-L-arabinose transferase-like glycosyltransferase
MKMANNTLLISIKHGDWKTVSKSLISPFLSINTLILVIGLSILMTLVLHLVFLTKFPPVFIDEPWYADAAWNWLINGINSDTMHVETRGNIPWPFLGNLPLLISFAAFGLGLFQARLVSWVFGILLMVFTVLVGRKLYNNFTGVLAALFLVLSTPFLWASHYARPDIMLSAIAMLCLLLVLIGFDRQNRWAHLAAGILMGLSLDIHLNGVLFIGGIAFLYLYYYGKRIFRSPGTWFFVAGIGIGLLYYIVVNMIANADNFLDFFRFSLGVSHPMPLLSLDPLELVKSVRDEIGRYHFFENRIDFVVIGASITYLFVRRSLPDKFLLLFAGTVFVGFVFFIGNKHDIYAILLYPYFLIMVAAALVDFFKKLNTFMPARVFAGTFIILYLFSSGIHLVRPLAEAQNYSYDAISSQIQSAIPPGSRVMGLPNWWLSLAGYDYHSSLGLSFLNHEFGYSLTTGLETIRPDYLIVDNGWRGLLVTDNYFSSDGFEIYNMPRKEFEEFLSSRGEKILDFVNPWHGSFGIYRINWNR